MENKKEFNLEITPLDWVYNEWTPLGKSDTVIDHERFLPLWESQKKYGTDWWACVSFAILNWLESEEIRQTGIETNYSDRFLASASGTVKGVGNTVSCVFDTLRDKGVCLESEYPEVKGEDYYKEILKEIYDLALKIKEKWNVYREWVNPRKKNDIIEALRQTTLPVTVRYASGDGILNPIGPHNHEVLLYKIDEDGNYWVFDNYSQHKKCYHKDYIFGSVLKPTLISKKQTMTFEPKDNHLYLLVEGPEQKLAMGLNGKLIVYKEKIDTIINSASRAKKWLIPEPITYEQWSSVDRLDGKLNVIVEAKI